MITAPVDTQAGVPAVETRAIEVRRGTIYLTREICDRYFPDVHSVALLLRDDRLLVVPLIQESAGGLLLKVRNARRDRVIHAQEFFRDKGFADDFDAQTVAVAWSSEWAALVLSGLRRRARWT